MQEALTNRLKRTSALAHIQLATRFKGSVSSHMGSHKPSTYTLTATICIQLHVWTRSTTARVVQARNRTACNLLGSVVLAPARTQRSFRAPTMKIKIEKTGEDPAPESDAMSVLSRMTRLRNGEATLQRTACCRSWTGVGKAPWLLVKRNGNLWSEYVFDGPML